MALMSLAQHEGWQPTWRQWLTGQHGIARPVESLLIGITASSGRWSLKRRASCHALSAAGFGL